MVTVEIFIGKTLDARGKGMVHARIPEIAAEYLIGTLPALHHLDLLRHHFREQIKRHRILAEHGLGHIGKGLGQARQHLVIGHHKLVVFGIEPLGNRVGILELIAFFLGRVFKTHGKGFQSLLSGFGQQAHQQAGIDAAGKQYTHRHIGDLHPLFHRPAQLIMYRLYPVGLGHGLFRSPGFQLPVAFFFDTAVVVNQQVMRRFDLADTFKHCTRRRHHRVQGKQMMHGGGVNAGVQWHTRLPVSVNNGLGIGGEQQLLAGLRVIQRFDTTAIARQQQTLATAIPEADGKHPLQTRNTVFAPFDIGAQNHLGIAGGFKAVPLALQLPA